MPSPIQPDNRTGEDKANILVLCPFCGRTNINPQLGYNWPAKWTDFTPLEMDKFRLWLNWHGKPSTLA